VGVDAILQKELLHRVDPFDQHAGEMARSEHENTLDQASTAGS
jgi:hypothetical protein